MIRNIFEHHEKIHNPVPYAFIFIISLAFGFIFTVSLSGTPISIIPFIIISLIGMIFSWTKIIIIGLKMPTLWEFVDEFFLLKNFQNPDFLILKKQKILLEKIIATFQPSRYNEKIKEYYFVNEIKINNKILFIREEQSRLGAEMKDFLAKNSNHPTTILQMQFAEIFEKIIQWRNDYKKDEKFDELAEISHFAMLKKSIFQGIIGTLLYFLAPFCLILFLRNEKDFWGNEDISTMITITMIVAGMMTFIFYGLKRLKIFTINTHLQEHFSLLVSGSISYLSALQKSHIIHHSDALFFADLINFLWENISERGKTLQKYEKFFTKIYTYFFIKCKKPQEIENFFIETKSKLRDDAILVQKIIEKWAEIEKMRLEKNSQNSHHPAILASNKRREMMIKNLQNISQK